MNTVKNQKKLIQLLYNKGDWIKCSLISEELGITERSVRYLIQQINCEDEVIVSSSKGYRLSDSFNAMYNYEAQKDHPQNAEEREKYIFEKLVITNQEKNIDELLDYFCISFNTFNNELLNWKKDLSPFNIYLKTKQGRIYSIGKERDRQKFAMSMIREELTQTSFSLEYIQSFFHNVDLFDIKDIVQKIFTRQQYYLDDYSLLTYVLHLALRIELGSNIISQPEPDDMDFKTMDVPTYMTDIIEEISEKLSERYPDVHLTKNEIFEASLLMVTRLVPKNSLPSSAFSDIRRVVGDDIADLYDRILAEINEIYAVDLNSFRFRYRFSLHIKNLVYRIRNNVALKEGQFSNIKDSYPFLFTIAVHISYLISNYIGKPLPENEICYIALHVGAILEEKNVKKERLVCGVLAQDYYELAENIANRIRQAYGDDISIGMIAANSDQLINSHCNYDLVISTYDVPAIPFPSINIGIFPDDEDIKRVGARIETLKEKKRQEEMVRNIETFFHEQICFFNQDLSTPEEVFDFVCDRLLELNLIEEGFKNGLYNHERVASSSYANFAIAHTLANNDKSTFVSLCINSKPIRWGSNDVSIVFIISVNKKDRGKFKTIFDSLTSVMFREDITPKLLQTKSYSEFMDIIRQNI